MSDRIKVLIADDHPLYRQALTQVLQQHFSPCEVVEVGDIQQLQQQLITQPDIELVLLDLHMPGAHGFSALIFLSAHFPNVPVIMISAHESADIVQRAMAHGASGFLSKSSDMPMLVAAIRQVLAGELCLPADYRDPGTPQEDERSVAEGIASLTPQQFRVVTMLAEGLLNKQIAWELQVTEATVKAHLTEIFRKLGVHSRTQAVLALSKLDVAAPSV